MWEYSLDYFIFLGPFVDFEFVSPWNVLAGINKSTVKSTRIERMESPGSTKADKQRLWVCIYLRTARILSTIFDIGGIFGGVLAGFISDMIDACVVTSILFLLLSIPALVSYRPYGSLSMLANIALLFLSGLLANGPYTLIITVVATNLGTQSSDGGNS